MSYNDNPLVVSGKLPTFMAQDTLFLAFSIRSKGSVVQYLGRVLRPTADKTSVEVHDYVDTLAPVLARMHHERLTAYASLGFDVPKQERRTKTP